MLIMGILMVTGLTDTLSKYLSSTDVSTEIGVKAWNIKFDKKQYLILFLEVLYILGKHRYCLMFPFRSVRT